MLKAKVSEAVQAIRRHTDMVPDIALTLGSGLGAFADHIDGVGIPYSGIPLVPVSTVQGHDGVLVVGTLFGRSCVAMRGRVHMYEGPAAWATE